MKKVKALILRTAGTNCDLETAHAFRLAGADAEFLHVNSVKMNRKVLRGFQILAIPGGFTYGDDVASGKILANEIRSSLREELAEFVREGKLIIGICNGFQVLVKMGLLPGLSRPERFNVEATLGLNDSGKFMSKWVYLKNVSSASSGKHSPWTGGLPDILPLPIAHAEGKFMVQGPDVLEAMKKNSQVVFRYCDDSGREAGFPWNPNGSLDNIAGVSDPSGRILGLMPHPERHVSYLQHPNWRRPEYRAEANGAGLLIFKSGVDFAKRSL